MRIRSIKPEFWRSEDIDALDWHVRLIFIGLWSYVDDNGVGIDKLSSIVADLFAADFARDPTETLNRVSTGLNVLQNGSQITRFSADGKRYLYVTNWPKHQRVTNPNRARFPLPTSGYIDPTETLNSSSVETKESLGTGAVEQWSSGAVEKDMTHAPAAPSRLYTPEFDKFWNTYPRRKNKAPAAKAFAKARKAKDPLDIIAAAAAYATDPNLPDLNFIPYPSTWLRAEGWNNGPCDPPPNAAAPKPSTTNARVNDVYAAGQRLAAAVESRNGIHHEQIPLEITG